jgi:hypothetical protein
MEGYPLRYAWFAVVSLYTTPQELPLFNYRSNLNSRRRPFAPSDALDPKAFVVGPVSDRRSGPQLRYAPGDGHQLCVRTRALADLLDLCVIDVVHFVGRQQASDQ